MVKQLGVPTIFLKLSRADLRWKEFLEIIQILNEAEFDISNLSYHDRCHIPNSNPVLVAKHFQYRVEFFFKLLIIDGPLGKSKHYANRVEFQIHGSPYVHSFIWVISAPKLTLHNVDECMNRLDNIVSACLPDAKVDSISKLIMNWWKLTRSIGIQKLVGDTKMITVVFILVDFSLIGQ